MLPTRIHSDWTATGPQSQQVGFRGAHGFAEVRFAFRALRVEDVARSEITRRVNTSGSSVGFGLPKSFSNPPKREAAKSLLDLRLCISNGRLQPRVGEN